MALTPPTYHVPPHPTPSPWLLLTITALPTGIGSAAWIGFFSLRRSRGLNHIFLILLILGLTAATSGLLVLWARRAHLRTGTALHLLGLLVGIIGRPALASLRAGQPPSATLAWVSADGLGMYRLTWESIAVGSAAAVFAAVSCWWVLPQRRYALGWASLAAMGHTLTWIGMTLLMNGTHTIILVPTGL